MKCKLYSESARQGEANSRGGDSRAVGAQPGSRVLRRRQGGRRKLRGWDRGGRRVGRMGGGASETPPLLFLHRGALNPSPASIIRINL